MTAQFLFQFNDMGQGDCCFVKCPDGRVVVVDCGSSSYFGPGAVYSALSMYKAVNSLRTQHFTGTNGNEVDALIFTHPDKDHYNQLLNVFGRSTWENDMAAKTLTISTNHGGSYVHQHADLPVMLPNADFQQISKIDNVYFSSSKSDTHPLGNYTVNGINNSIYDNFFNVPEINEVTINADHHFRKRWKQGQFREAPTTIGLDSKWLEILSGKIDGMDWRVSIIAGNVPNNGSAVFGDDHIPDPAEVTNTMSLITLFQVGDKKALLLGDGSFSTEAFLVAQHGDLIGESDLVLVGHHGSSTTSSCQNFVDAVRAKMNMVSVGFMEHSNCLPREDALARWLNYVAESEAEHIVDYWEDKQNQPQTYFKDLYTQWTTDADYVEHYNVLPGGVTTYKYLDPKPGKPMHSGLIYAFQSKGGYTLFRESTKYPIYMTSMDTKTYLLSAE